MKQLASITLLATGISLTAAACDDTARGNRDLSQSGTATWDSAAWRPPSFDKLPNDSLGNAVRRGLALVTATPDSLRRFVGANLTCTSCHLDQGRRGTAAPLTGVFARYPK